MQQSKYTKFQTLGLELNESKHNIFNIAVIVLNCLTFVVTVFINAAASNPSIGIFKNSTSVVSANNEIDITPAGWTFATWGIIYTWQALWLLYNVVIIFIKTEYGPLYQNPPVLTIVFHILIFINLVLNISWLFLWDSQKLTVSFVFIVFMTLALYAALILSHKNIHDAEQVLNINKKRVYLWLYRILVNNGVAFYATWITIASAINFAIAFTYEWNGGRSAGSIVALSGVSVLLLTYFVLEILVFEKYLRYTFSVYLQLIIALSGVLSKQWSSQTPSAIFSLVLIILTGIFLLVKTVVTIYKHKNRRVL